MIVSIWGENMLGYLSLHSYLFLEAHSYALGKLFASGLYKLETGYNLLMEYNKLTNYVIVPFTLVCLRLAFICKLGQLYH